MILALELFCGAGLVHEGLTQAGIRTVGVDNTPQRSYRGHFLLHDALTLDERFLDLFRIIWASPPCKDPTVLNASARREQRAHAAEVTKHPDLIGPTRAMLRRWADRTGGYYVLENVEQAKLIDPVVLCGSMFSLGVTDGGRRFHLERHRKFETNWPLEPPCACNHQKPVVGVYGGHARNRSARFGGRGTRDPWTRPHPEIMAEAMGLERRDLTGGEIDQGIPPIYARYIAEQLLAHMAGRQRTAA